MKTKVKRLTEVAYATRLCLSKGGNSVPLRSSNSVRVEQSQGSDKGRLLNGVSDIYNVSSWFRMMVIKYLCSQLVLCGVR
jgi:hypothetical protein